MRFQQLKSDSNMIMRKKLVKSKKNWIVISSLTFAGGIFLIGTPDMVQAATVKTAVTNPMPSNIGGNSSSPALNPVNKDTKVSTKTVKEDVKTPISPIKAPTPVADVSNKAEPVAKPVVNNVKPSTLITETSKENTEPTLKPSGSIKPAPTTPTDTKPQVTKSIQTPKASSINEQEDTAEIAKKIDHGAGWKITDNGTNLLINGPLTDQKGDDTEHWGGYTKQITTINIDKEVNAPLKSSYLFANMENLTIIKNLGNLKFIRKFQ
ncbi:KxYKxGKxW signal peptide domain-containing protein [Companilactobacillus muriivasis]|uniref:KxYKxGKxW signal peptide domain-containing protein n=1 Tax=Companilactobacillus muriivasis TaxID=3081444 RepID=UPI0030C6A1B3